MHQVIPDIGDAFRSVDKEIQDSLIPDLFQGIG